MITLSLPGRKPAKYKWCGYYLNSPCHSAGTFAPFTGKAAFLHSLGLGLAIIYVGFQQEGCGSAQLTNQRGILHGMDAVAKCQSEGFPNQAIIFLDVEFFNGSITAAFAEYYRGWLSAVLASQLFQPGTYVAAANFSDIYLAAQQEYAAYGLSSAGPAIWIALEDTSFDPVNDAPTDSGIAQANVWQGLLDVQQSQGGIALTVDLDTADSPDPSQSRVTPTIVIIDYTLSQ